MSVKIKQETVLKDKLAFFIGHHDYYGLPSDVLDTAIENLIQDGVFCFYNGGTGHFDSMCMSSINRLKKKYPHIRHYMILPYLDFSGLDQKHFDGTLYPELEAVPKRFVYTHRNRWMVKQCSHALCLVNHHWGGAYKIFRSAIYNGLKVINLGSLPLDKT